METEKELQDKIVKLEKELSKDEGYREGLVAGYGYAKKEVILLIKMLPEIHDRPDSIANFFTSLTMVVKRINDVEP